MLSRNERRGLGVFFTLFVLLGLVTEFRAVCQERPKGDLLVFLRTAWAVRTGLDIYTITDHNGWHYHYPPLLAIFMTPLANPPPFTPLPYSLPYSVSVAIWFALSVGLLFGGTHLLAGALEEATGQTSARGSRRWWAWRVVPIAACLPPIAHALIRGQVGLLLLFLLCGAAAALVRKRGGQAGFWLAGAICLKVIPAFLLLYPAWRREPRCLAGCALGLVIGLAAIPAAVFGPARTVEYYREWTGALLLPALAKGDDHARDTELLNVTATHSQSFLPVLHNLLNPDETQRPSQAAPSTRRAHWCIAALLTLFTLAVAGRRADDGGARSLLFFGALMLLMVLSSPICHTHYFVLSVPIVMGLMAMLPAPAEKWVDRRLGVMFAVNLAANALPLLDGLEPLRDFGVITLAALSLWLTACLLLHRSPEAARPMIRESARQAA